MKQSNRLLLLLGSAMVVLAVVAAVIVFMKSKETIVLLPESEPAGVVQRYIIATQSGDFEGAQKFVTPPESPFDPAFPKPRPLPAPIPPTRDVSWRATLGDTRIVGDRAQVDITAYVFRPGGPFGDPVQTIYQTFLLVKQENAWLIEDPVSLWWLY